MHTLTENDETLTLDTVRFIEETETLRITKLQALILSTNFLSLASQFQHVLAGYGSQGEASKVWRWYKSLQSFLFFKVTLDVIYSMKQKLCSLSEKETENKPGSISQISTATKHCENIYKEAKKIINAVVSLLTTT